MRRVATVLLLALLGAASCGVDEPAPLRRGGAGRSSGEPSDTWREWYERNKPHIDALKSELVPPWAKVTPEQIAEAKKRGVPVAFENDLGMRFVLIPAGSFVMGSPTREIGRPDDEASREVAVGAFYLHVTETTNGQYKQFRPAHDSGTYWDHEGVEHDLGVLANPVTRVSWFDAQEFAEWLERRDGLREYRLPSEEEWEYAARAGSGTPFFFGDSKQDFPKYGNLADKKTSFRHRETGLVDEYIATAPVASFRPNPWGLYDMLGNVWEWSADWYPEDVDPHRQRVLRGGSWGDDATLARCATRLPYDPAARGMYYGFRLVSPLPERGD